jgi:cytochrome P450
MARVSSGRCNGDTDLADPLLEGAVDPYPVYRRLREVSPVHWSDAFGAWLVTGYHQVRAVYRGHDRFSNRAKFAGNLSHLPPDVRARVSTVELAETTPALSSADPPVLTRQRSMVMKSLTPRRLEQKRQWAQELCEELAESLARRPDPDLISDFSMPLSYRSILGLFGAPMELAEICKEATYARGAFTGRVPAQGGLVEAALRYEDAIVALREGIEALYPHLQGQNDGSIISTLLQPTDPGHVIAPDELFVMLRNFMAAGQENIVFTVATTIHELLRNPDQLELVKADPSLAADAYEEAIRFDTPAQANGKIAAVDTELEGRLIRAGDRILNVKGSANRDPAVWTDPDRFDLTRDQSEPDGGSVVFGQGVHFCAGSGVARLEGPIAVATLLRRFPNMHLREGWTPTWKPGPLQRKLNDLPLALF